jgi:hypothetical protein
LKYIQVYLASISTMYSVRLKINRIKRLVILLGALTLPLLAKATSTVDLTNNSGWGANIGWTNWRPDFDGTNTEGVIVGEFICSGNVYASNIGWISLGGGSPVNHIQYQNNSTTDFGVNYSVDSTQPGVGIFGSQEISEPSLQRIPLFSRTTRPRDKRREYCHP